jgi:hypothetical protein
VWNQEGRKLVGTDVIGPFQLQAISVTLSGGGNTAIIGGFADDNNMGAAWVFTRSDGVWTQKAKLIGTGAIGAAGQELLLRFLVTVTLRSWVVPWTIRSCCVDIQ